MHDVDFDLSDSARALIRNGINIDDPLRRRGHQDGAPQYGHGPDRLDQPQFPVSFARDGERDLVGCENRRDLRRFLKEVGAQVISDHGIGPIFSSTRAPWMGDERAPLLDLGRRC